MRRTMAPLQHAVLLACLATARGATPVQACAQPVPEPVDLLRLIDPEQDGVEGDWTRSKEALVSPAVPRARLQIPYLPPEDYDLTLVAELKGEPESLNIGLPVGGKRVQAILGGWKGTTSGLHLIDRKGADENETTVAGAVFQAHRPRTIVCSVRRDRVGVTVDGEKLLDWKADVHRISEDEAWAAGDPGTFFIGSYATSFEISRIELRPISGTGRMHRVPRRGTRMIGGAGGEDFEDFANPQELLVGLRVTWDYYLGSGMRNGDIVIVKTVQPVFQGKDRAHEGRIHGTPTGPSCINLVAQPGYAIGGLIVKGGAGVDGFRVVFLRIGEGGLDPKDRYESDWFGGRGGGPETLLGGDGRPIAGILGREGQDLDALGLVYGNPKAADLAALRAVPETRHAFRAFPPGQADRPNYILGKDAASAAWVGTAVAGIALGIALLVPNPMAPMTRRWLGSLGGLAVGLGGAIAISLKAKEVHGPGMFFIEVCTQLLRTGSLGVLLGVALARVKPVAVVQGSGMALGAGAGLAIVGYVAGIPFGTKDFVSLGSLLAAFVAFTAGVPVSAALFIPLMARRIDSRPPPGVTLARGRRRFPGSPVAPPGKTPEDPNRTT